MVDRAEKVGHLPQMFLASVLSATECRLNLNFINETSRFLPNCLHIFAYYLTCYKF